MTLLPESYAAGASGHLAHHAQVAKKLNTVVDMEGDFAADPTGASDCLAKFVLAKAAVASNGGGVIRYGPGTFVTSNTQEVDQDNTYVVGVPGATLVATDTFINAAGAIRPVLEFSADSGNRKNVGVSGLWVDGNRDGQSNSTEFAPGIQFRTSGANTLRYGLVNAVRVFNTAGDNLTFRSDGTTPYNQPTGIPVLASFFEDPNPAGGGYNARQGIAIIGGRDIPIIGNRFSTMPAAAIDLEPNGGNLNTIAKIGVILNLVEDAATDAIFATTASTEGINGLVIALNDLTATTNGIRLRTNGANMTGVTVGPNSYSASVHFKEELIAGSIAYTTDLVRATMRGPMALGEPGRDTFDTASSVPSLYYANATFESETSMAGALILQSRPTASRPIVFVTGSTPTERMRLGAAAGATGGGITGLNGKTGPQVLAGSGTPEGNVTAPVGSVWLRTNGGANTSLYVKESGTGNTGWVAK